MDDCSYQAKFNSQVLKGVKTNDCLGICLKNNDMSQKWLVIMYSLCDLNPNLNLCFSNVFLVRFPFKPSSLHHHHRLALHHLSHWLLPQKKTLGLGMKDKNYTGTLKFDIFVLNPWHYYLLSIVCVGTTGSRQMWVFTWSFTQKGR